jgi:hypothetical protein
VHAPPLQQAFDTEALDVTRWAICVGLASAVLWVDEIRKALQRRRRAAALEADR